MVFGLWNGNTRVGLRETCCQLARLIHEGVRGEMMGGDEAVGLA
jgi:hypothetical protein